MSCHATEEESTSQLK